MTHSLSFNAGSEQKNSGFCCAEAVGGWSGFGGSHERVAMFTQNFPVRRGKPAGAGDREAAGPAAPPYLTGTHDHISE